MSNLIIGIDEVGRGPIAGPVAVGAFVFLDKNVSNLFNGVKESKQLSHKKREEWFLKIEEEKKKGTVDFVVNLQSEEIIDTLGISHAIRMALNESLEDLRLDPDLSSILLDGGLKAPDKYKKQKTIIKGDEKEMVIALASICAKVTRDRLMMKYGEKYTQYGFEKHMGYGTKAHYEAIIKNGMLNIHRISYMKKFLQKIGK